MASSAHDQALIEGDAFATRYWQTAEFTHEPSNSWRTIFQWPTGEFSPAVQATMTAAATAAIEAEATALTTTRRRWNDPTCVDAWRAAAQAQAHRLFSEVARFPAPS